MVAPINYIVPGRVDLAQKMREGLLLGQNIRQGIDQRQQRREEEDRQKQFKAELQTAIQSGSLKALKDLQLKYPKLSEGLKDRIGEMSADQRRNELTSALEMRNAAKAGDAETVGILIDQRINAAMAEGKDTSSLERLRNAADVGNMGAVVSGLNVGLLGLMGPEDFGKLADQEIKSEKAPLELRKVEAEAELAETEAEFSPKKYAADLGLTEAQTNKALADTKKLSADTRKTILEIEATKKSGGLVKPEQVPDLEAKLRAEYTKGTQGYQETLENYRRMEAAEDNAAGDLALIFLYMKMLDPGSVVREGEFATAQNASGVPERIRNSYNNAINGERLSADQRKMFKGQAKGLLDASAKTEKELRSGLGKVAKNYGLNEENIFVFSEERSSGEDPLGLR